MRTFHHRRRTNLLITAAVIALLIVVFQRQRNALSEPSFTTGYWLAAVVVFLLALNWRKKFSYLPIGNASTWMQFHIYAGWLSIPIFVMHVGLRIPNGPFEIVLGSLYLLVASSGVFGLYLTRTYPKRLSNVSEEFLFEQIPAHRSQLQQTTRRLVLQTVGPHGSILAEFYANRLGAYFEQPRGLRFHLFPETRTRRKMMSELASVQRYLTDGEKKLSDQLFRSIRKKDDLDYQFALQWTLKAWLIIHIALSYSLLLLGAVHIVIVHRFHGGW